MQYSAKKNFLLVLAIISSVYPLYTTAQVSTFSHEKEQDYGSIPHIIFKSLAYDDGTAVVRIVRVNATATSNCFHERLSLRIIHPNGTVGEKDIELDIPPFNYCFFYLYKSGLINRSFK